MIKVYEKRGGGNVIAVEETPWGNLSRYGVVAPQDWQDNHFLHWRNGGKTKAG